MSELNALFRKRIGIPEDETITFETLDLVLEKTATSIPFENLCILEKNVSDITKDYLMNKMLVKHEGGLCYELNSLLYFFLIENGFQAVLSRGVVYKGAAHGYHAIGQTHVTILITHEDRMYLVDTGFGGNLPLTPVPLIGEVVASRNGEFRVRHVNTEHGDYVLEMKLKHKDTDWRIGYAFRSDSSFTDVGECNEVQTIIAEHEESPFNKNPVITRMTKEGNMTLTDASFTQWVDGTMTKVSIDNERFKELLKQHFGLSTTL